MRLLISNVLIDSNTSNYEFVSTNDVLIKYDDTQEKIKNPNNKQICLLPLKNW